ncbi:MAG TPA: carbonic anhydrase [Desulfobulbus sp.]|nr:carbonic anhydrase [Desulfobulbus sp.]
MKSPEIITGRQALERLLRGNQRFARGVSRHPRHDPDRRKSLDRSQEPFAAILACADSRVPPEVIFDQGLGDIFAARVAGNILNDQVLGSLEYAACHLDVPLIMVLAHTNCGAVKAVADGTELQGHIASLAPAIRPAVERARGMEGDLTDNAAREVARMTAGQLAASEPLLAPLAREGRLTITAAFYHLDSGRVELLS